MSGKYDPEVEESIKKRRSVQKACEQHNGPEAARPRIDDPAFSPALLAARGSRTRGNAPVQAAAITQLQQTQGNRYAQRVVQRSAPPAFIQRMPDTKKADNDTGKGSGNKDDKGGSPETSNSLFAKDDDQSSEILRAQLDEAEDICKKAAASEVGAEAQKRLEDASQKFSLLSKAVGTGFSLKAEGAPLISFTNALKELRELDMDRERGKAAQALSELFAATGELANAVTQDGPWQGYLKLLGEEEAFFAPAEAKNG
ncbi:MAG: hypothetical protein IVW55_06225 [Chloroflexi bacterium]|nr:hypothetical protein [Chloroflexota bacterium]